MQKLKDVMSTDVQVIRPDASLKQVALTMKEIGTGALPVCDADRLIGMVTDRDIVIRTLAENRDPNSLCAKDVMTSPIVYCFEDQDVGEAARLMEVKQIRRLIVLDRNKRLVGVCSLGDIAVKAGIESLSGEVLEKVSEPTRGKAA